MSAPAGKHCDCSVTVCYIHAHDLQLTELRPGTSDTDRTAIKIRICCNNGKNIFTLHLNVFSSKCCFGTNFCEWPVKKRMSSTHNFSLPTFSQADPNTLRKSHSKYQSVHEFKFPKISA